MADSKKQQQRQTDEKATAPSRNQAAEPERTERAVERSAPRKLPRREGVRVIHDQPATNSAIKKEADQRAKELEKQRDQRRKDRENAPSRQQRLGEQRAQLTGDDTKYPRQSE